MQDKVGSQSVPINNSNILSQQQSVISQKEAPNNESPRIIQAIIKIQKNIRASVICIKLKEEFKKINRRKRIIKQLIETEINYIRDLGFIVSDFKMRMQSRGILNQEQGRKLFANVDEIRKLHQIFLSTLDNHYSNYHPHRVIFAQVLNSIPYFRIYIDYLNNFPFACDLVNEYKKSKPGFAAFVSQIGKSQHYHFLSLQDYMVKPVQRLPKYVLLLKQLIKNTHSSHLDYHNVKKALQKFEQVNSNNNEKLNKIRNNFKLREIQDLLQLPEGIITPSTQFIIQETVQILNRQNEVVSNCIFYLLSNYIILSKRYGTLLNRQTHMNSTITHSARVSQMYGYTNNTMKQKLEGVVALKYGTSIKLNKDQCFFKNSFIVQSTQGQSCTFICSNQEQLHNLYTKIKKQIDFITEQTISKLKSMFQNENLNHNSTFIRGISMLDLVPEVTVLGTSERTDKMLKYTIYIVEVKIKMIKQKIFLRFSELLELEKFIVAEYGKKIQIKQGLVNSSWLNNHHQKTIEERKMNVQRFLKQILSKPEVIQNGWRILLRLGLPEDFYELPKKILENRTIESFVKKSTVIGKSIVPKKKKNFRSYNKNNHSYRLSIFQQQKIQQIQQEEEQDYEEEIKHMIKNSFENQEVSNIKSNFGGSYMLCIQDLLKANEIDLGHYTRMQSISLSDFGSQKEGDTTVTLQILVPSIQHLSITQKNSAQKFDGFKQIVIKCSKLQRIQNIIPIIAKEINLRYYKDFRLLAEKQYSQRILDDDELVHKVLAEIKRTKSSIVLRKVIYIEHQIEEKQLTRDKERLSVMASQIINQIKMGKYRLNYESYLKFAVLLAIVYQESHQQEIQMKAENLNIYARVAKEVVLPKYSSLSQTDDIWVSDFIRAYNIIITKLKQISKMNVQHIEKEKLQNQVSFHSQENLDHGNSLYWANTKLKYLALLSIVRQIEKKQCIYGCIQFSVQINQKFKEYLENEGYQYYAHSISSEIEKEDRPNEIPNRNSESSQVNQQLKRKLSDQQNKNCWLAIKHSKVILTSITKSMVLFQIEYDNIVKVQPYSSTVELIIKNMPINSIRLKTTSSYYIRQMLYYYKNYRSVLKKICSDTDLKDSIIEMARQQLGVYQHQQMDECYV